MQAGSSEATWSPGHPATGGTSGLEELAKASRSPGCVLVRELSTSLSWQHPQQSGFAGGWDFSVGWRERRGRVNETQPLGISSSTLHSPWQSRNRLSWGCVCPADQTWVWSSVAMLWPFPTTKTYLIKKTLVYGHFLFTNPVGLEMTLVLEKCPGVGQKKSKQGQLSKSQFQEVAFIQMFWKD